MALNVLELMIKVDKQFILSPPQFPLKLIKEDIKVMVVIIKN
jgi:hypothetical protein